jgi:plasmid stabilization system protein ParE
MSSVTILHEAEVELWEAVAYYEQQSTGLGLDFGAELEASLEAICYAPERWPLRPDGTRRYLTPRFPYVVVYLYLQGRVWVIAIAHCKRRPGYWTQRVKTADRAP